MSAAFRRQGNCRTIKGKDTRYKLHWSGNDKGTAGVGVCGGRMDRESFCGAESLEQNNLSKLIVGQCVVTFLSMYTPQSGLSDELSCVL